MMSLDRWIKIGSAACIGTVFAEVLFLTVMLAGGHWKQADVNVMLAICYGVDEQTLAEYYEELSPRREFSLVDVNEEEQTSTASILNIDMRERSLNTAIDDLRYYQKVLTEERDRYDRLRTDFEQQLARLEGVANNANLIRLRDTISNLSPTQAKEQIMTMLEQADESGDQEIANDVVVMIKTMPIDKRKKIFSEFQTIQEKKRLGFIVHELRVGNPEVPLIRKVRERLRQFDSQETTDTT